MLVFQRKQWRVCYLCQKEDALKKSEELGSVVDDWNSKSKEMRLTEEVVKSLIGFCLLMAYIIFDLNTLL